jgi:signal peptidase
MQLFTKTIYWAFMIAVLGLGALLMISLVPIAHTEIKIVKSGSMEPAIKTGGVVLIHPAATYKVGDIITFGADTKTQIPTTHRIVAVEGQGASAVFTTKGDANDADDPARTRVSDVHGKVLATVPYVGYILNFARQPLGFALLVGVPAAFIILEELGKIVRELRRMRPSRRKQEVAYFSQTTSHATEQRTYIRPRVD